MKVMFSAGPIDWEEWETPLREAMAAQGFDPDLLARKWPEDEVDAIVYAPVHDPEDGIRDFSLFPKLKLVQSIWAGVERIQGDKTLTAPLARMVDPGLAQGMMEYCVGHTLRHHLDLDYWAGAQDGVWRLMISPIAWERKVCVLGLGALGSRVAEALRLLGFPVSGWSRRPKDLPGISCFSGEEGLDQALDGAEFLILLLPLTGATKHVINAERLAKLAKGAFVINGGRGPLIDDDALLAALDDGQVGHATLDVFAKEPLKPAHPYWDHPHVTVTPHIASITRPSTAAPVVAENLARLRDGQALLNLVDREAGY